MSEHIEYKMATKCIFCNTIDLSLSTVYTTVDNKEDVTCYAIVCNTCGVIYPGIIAEEATGIPHHKIAELALNKMRLYGTEKQQKDNGY